MKTEDLEFAPVSENLENSEATANKQEKKEKAKKVAATVGKGAAAAGLGFAGAMAAKAMNEETPESNDDYAYHYQPQPQQSTPSTEEEEPETDAEGQEEEEIVDPETIDMTAQLEGEVEVEVVDGADDEVSGEILSYEGPTPFESEGLEEIIGGDPELIELESTMAEDPFAMSDHEPVISTEEYEPFSYEDPVDDTSIPSDFNSDIMDDILS